MKYWISAILAGAIALATTVPAEAATKINWGYVGHCVKKVALLPVYPAFGTAASLALWLQYGGYEKEELRDLSKNLSEGVHPDATAAKPTLFIQTPEK